MIGREYRQYLIDQGFSDVFLNYRPDSPDDVIAIYDEAAPTLPIQEGLTTEQSGIEVLVRAGTPKDAEDTIKSIHGKTIGFRNDVFTTGGFEVTIVKLQQPPSYVDRDDQNRAMWSAHYIVRHANNTQYRS